MLLSKLQSSREYFLPAEVLASRKYGATLCSREYEEVTSKVKILVCFSSTFHFGGLRPHQYFGYTAAHRQCTCAL